jgi:hypothetical protein
MWKWSVLPWCLASRSNGETALHLVGSQQLDFIFMDQDTASVEKQLLRSEATLALRAKGVSSIICGLSANDARDKFIKACRRFYDEAISMREGCIDAHTSPGL